MTRTIMKKSPCAE